MLRSRLRYVWAGLVFVLAAATAAAQQPISKVTLDTSETIFSTLAGISHCGYAGDAGDDIRREVLADMAKAVAASEEARTASRELCQFYQDHHQPDPSRDLAQYISLALEMGPPPKFDLKVKEADLPPDASYVLGFRPLLINFASALNLHQIWMRHEYEYNALIERFHGPVSNLLLATDVYLRMPLSGYAGRNFVVYLEPMAGPGPVNARNYGADYFLVTSPQNHALPLDSIRHTYLHFIVDPLVGKRASVLKRLGPILPLLASAPLADSYKHDPSLLVSESLIRALEARLAGKGPKDEPMRVNMVKEDMAEGFVLTRYFFNQLAGFEKGQNGFQDALADFLYQLDIDHEKKVAQQQVFTSKAAPEVLATSQPSPLEQATQRFQAGDYEAAHSLALQALQSGTHQGEALFLLGQIASLNGDMPGAQKYFTQAAATGTDPHVIAWSNIYLGRIADLQQERETALAHYNAALRAGDAEPQAKAAAERGLKQAYEPPPQARKKESE